MSERTTMTATWSGWERRGLWALLAFTVVTVLGFATFGRHPELLARFPEVAGFYPVAFAFFARGHVLLALGALVAVLVHRTGFRWLPAFGLVCLLSLGAELLGTATGFPFGDYSYTTLLGPKVAGLVPWLIPPSWFLVALPAYALAAGGFPTRGRPFRWVVGAVLLTTWDLTLDPAMSTLSPYWTWGVEGAFYGMPVVNLAGWFATGLVLMAGLDLVRADSWVSRIPLGYHVAFYAAVLSLSAGMVLVAGFFGAVVLTIAVLGALFFLHAAEVTSDRWLTPSPRLSTENSR